MFRSRRAIAATLVLAFLPALSLAAQIDARMLRQPDVSATQLAFVYAGDIWIASRSGGVAQRLSSPAGEESFPRFSPDGHEIAFTGDYDGNQDIYVMPAAGGVADDPSQIVKGVDPQLEAAIQEVTKELQQHPYTAPKRPPYQNRTPQGKP